MSQNFFEKHYKGFERSAKNMKYEKIFSADPFNNVYEAILGSLAIMASAVAFSMFLYTLSNVISVILALAAVVLITLAILDTKANDASRQNYAILALASALLVNVLPYLMLAGTGALIIFKSNDLISSSLKLNEEKSWFGINILSF